MSNPFGKRILNINGMEQVYDNIEDLAVDIEYRHTELRGLHEILSDEMDNQKLDRIQANALAQRDRLDAYNSWAAQILAANKANIEELQEELRKLPPSPFEEGSWG